MQYRHPPVGRKELSVIKRFFIHRKAFTMLEVVLVIAVLGIVSSLGSQIIVQVYESYITQKSTFLSSMKTELAITQIANRLAYAVPDTIIGRKSATDATFMAIDDLDANDYQVLEWVGYDADSFGAVTPSSRRAGWSGFCDVNASSINSISTPGSQLGAADTVISNLSSRDLNDTALFFSGTYNTRNIGYDANTSGVSTVASGSGETLLLDAAAGRNISEQYKLAWSSYAVVPLNCVSGRCDLELRYDIQPWGGTSYSSTTSRSILLRNVTVFQFTGSANTIRLKICQQEFITSSYPISTCKEKAIIR
jgi:prepilin-type N-terminal cleavage/methylation domain-containing protein